MNPSVLLSPKVWLALAFAGVLALAGWFYMGMQHAQTALAQNKQASAETLTKIANLTSAALQEALATAKARDEALAKIDKLATEGKDHELQQNEAIRAAVRAGTQRLRIAAVCPASGSTGDVPQASSAGGVGPASTVELTSAAGQDVLDIRAGIISDQAALKYLQQYAVEVCGK